MVSIHIITVGKDKDRWVSDASDHYLKLLSKYARLELISVPEAKYTKNADIPACLKREADAIKKRLKGGFPIILDVDGKRPNTEELSRKFIRWQNRGNSFFEFIIGGPYGLDDKLRSSGEFVLSLSPLTMSHQVVRVVLLEQLYRVFNLASGGSYHK